MHALRDYVNIYVDSLHALRDYVNKLKVYMRYVAHSYIFHIVQIILYCIYIDGFYYVIPVVTCLIYIGPTFALYLCSIPTGHFDVSRNYMQHNMILSRVQTRPIYKRVKWTDIYI